MPRILDSPRAPQALSPTSAGSAAASDDRSPAAREAFLELLGRLSEHEEAFIEELYARFFALRPDAVVLFGEYSISEREEMVRETFRCLLAWLDEEPWLEANLRALGQSHAEYGVEGEMYPPFVDALIASVVSVSEAVPGSAADAQSEPAPDASTLALVRNAAEAIVATMRSAGDA